MVSLSPRRRGTLTVLVGFALLLNPFVVGHFDIGDPDRYEYEASEVSFTEYGTSDIPRGVDVVDPQIACLDGYPPSRSCVLERAIHANGGLWYDGPPAHFLRSDYEYVFTETEGFHELVAREGADNQIKYDSRPVPTDEALDRVATEYEHAPRKAQFTIDSGSYAARDPIDGANELVEKNGSYYVVHETRVRRNADERSQIVVLGQWVFGIAGAGLVMKGQRARVEAEA
ncbi:hypothetical protein SAMN04487949_3772 [Halogranum gelatinilyticum]|uniref:Uncharacterized protein n=1 Tax=Halogranum gelatinilyticum TaxID=660521 RepID=A0A1H0A1M8_9EURY|nr:hypothetical protein [Halogranum gelatinilyticum]SDN26566.1 hypothetical protein SAMN04487949_3772 [Halogranum gelatinilyticum]